MKFFDHSKRISSVEEMTHHITSTASLVIRLGTNSLDPKELIIHYGAFNVRRVETVVQKVRVAVSRFGI